MKSATTAMGELGPKEMLRVSQGCIGLIWEAQAIKIQNPGDYEREY
jgi:hypothetical protein